MQRVLCVTAIVVLAVLANLTIQIESFAQNAQTKTAYVCVETQSTGFRLDAKQKTWLPAKFASERFTIVFDRDTASLKSSNTGQVKTLQCKRPWQIKPDLYQCTESFTVFSFDEKLERFTLAHMFSFIDDSPDTLTIGYGICQKF